MDDTERSPLPKVRIEALALRQHGLLLPERRAPTHQVAAGRPGALEPASAPGPDPPGRRLR
ncbi:MAG: hypothetical protein ACRDY2_11355 [Acidimicrobiales bacterium]